MMKVLLHIVFKCCIITFLMLLLFSFDSFAQRRSKEQARYEIDAKRYGIDVKSEETLPRAKEFVRLDSTYYVGWMLEGMYKYERSADALGFKNAILPLQKSYKLISTEFDEVFANMFSNYDYLSKNITRFHDLMIIVDALIASYDNVDMPDSSVQILDDIKKYNFKVDNLEDYAFGQYFHRAWLFHRNRFYTSRKFPFLKNNIAANQQAAYQISYEGLHYTETNKALADEWFGESINLIDKLRIYHNLAILHSYNKRYDSSVHYYAQLNEYGVMSDNNYASLQYELANFADADHYYNRAIEDAEDYSLQEPFYFLPQLYVFSGKIGEAIKVDKEIITAKGSTPGFGWYNIALARSYLYDGQLDSCGIALNKAINFDEVHIGTTLTQAQYEFTINLLKLQLIDRRIEKIKFQNRGWWYSLKTLWKIFSISIEKWITIYNTASQLAKNPEKDRMVYDLFCSESTTTYDEAWYLLKYFSSSYFEKKYKNYQITDLRKNADRYFKLFEAKFQLRGGKIKTARESFDKIINNVAIDTTFEKLYIGRLYEGAILSNNIFTEKYNTYSNDLYSAYPELIPFSGIEISMQLHIHGSDNDMLQNVVKDIKKAHVNWSEKQGIPKADVYFEQRGNKYRATINTYNAEGKPVVVNENLFFSNTSNAGAEILMRIFGKGGAEVI